MKKIKSLFLAIFLLPIVSYAQNQEVMESIISKIEATYKTIDTTLYLQRVSESYKQYLTTEFLSNANALAKIGLSGAIDTMATQQRYSDFSNHLYSSKPCFVLNIKNCEDTLAIENSDLPFNLLFFNPQNKLYFFVGCKNGKYRYHNTTQYELLSTKSKSRKFAKRMIKSYKHILRQQPTYILHYSLNNDSTIITYVLNDKIYVYDVDRKKKYEIQDYIQKNQ